MVEAPFLLIRAALPHMYGNSVRPHHQHLLGARDSGLRIQGRLRHRQARAGGPVQGDRARGRPARGDKQLREPGLRAHAAGDKQIADQARYTAFPRTEVVAEILLKESAIKRLVEPEEVASLVGWLASPGRRDGDRRVVHHGRRLERPLTAASRPAVPQWQPAERNRRGRGHRFRPVRAAARTQTVGLSVAVAVVGRLAAFWGALWEYFELGDAPASGVGEGGDAGRSVVPGCG